jgi:ATP/maltotriose-dependent transcriptional regulator MalT
VSSQMTRHTRLVLTLAASLALAGSAVAQGKPETCAAKLTLAEVKLASEIERSDAQAYLIRLELAQTKRQLAAALAKCGGACAKP